MQGRRIISLLHLHQIDTNKIIQQNKTHVKPLDMASRWNAETYLTTYRGAKD